MEFHALSRRDARGQVFFRAFQRSSV